MTKIIISNSANKLEFKNYKWLKNSSGLKKLLLCFAFAIVVYSLLWLLKIDLKSSIILSWDTFCLCMILLSWLLFFNIMPNELCTIVEKQDDGLKVIFMIVVIAVIFSLIGTLALIDNEESITQNKLLHFIISLSPVVFSWILLHTTFTIRYAHLYHDHNLLNTGSIVGGIKFPVKTKPDYLDFAYFSFVIGMTFQVSDVVITSQVIRRFVLLHSLISFVFNTVIVALTISAISNLK